MRAPVPEEEEGNLPNIDDLQVAAAAAAGKKDPVWPVLRKALGEEVSSDEEDEAEGTKAETNAEQVDADMKEAAAEVRGALHSIPATNYITQILPILLSELLLAYQPILCFASCYRQLLMRYQCTCFRLRAKRRAQKQCRQTQAAPAQTKS